MRLGLRSRVGSLGCRAGAGRGTAYPEHVSTCATQHADWALSVVIVKFLPLNKRMCSENMAKSCRENLSSDWRAGGEPVVPRQLLFRIRARGKLQRGAVGRLASGHRLVTDYRARLTWLALLLLPVGAEHPRSDPDASSLQGIWRSFWNSRSLFQCWICRGNTKFQPCPLCLFSSCRMWRPSQDIFPKLGDAAPGSRLNCDKDDTPTHDRSADYWQRGELAVLTLACA